MFIEGHKKQKGASKQNELKFLYTEPGNLDITFGDMINIDINQESHLPKNVSITGVNDSLSKMTKNAFFSS